VFVILNVPVLLAVPMTVPFTEIEAPLFAPLPCTESVVPCREADETRMVEVLPPLPLPELPEPLLKDGALGCNAVGSDGTGSWQATARTTDAAPHATTRCLTILLISSTPDQNDAIIVSGTCWDAQRAYGERAFGSGERLTTSAVGSLEVG
jgi:hypothetical protein